jgi:Peptidase family S41
MSEKIYTLLLSLYPSSFRQEYGEEALQLARDRIRDERGAWRKLRLWVDLLLDLAISAPRQHFRTQPALAAAPPQGAVSGVPSFRLLEDEPMRFGTVVVAGLLAVGALGMVLILLNRTGGYRPGVGTGAKSESGAVRWSPSPSIAGMPQGDSDAEAMGAGGSRSQAGSTRGQSAGSVLVRVEAAERQRVIDAVTQNLREHYFDSGEGRKIADGLLVHAQHGDYDAMTEGGAFAEAVTRQLRDVSQNMDLVVVYSASVLPSGPPPGAAERYRAALLQSNCTFEKVEVLVHNIGYVKLNSFPDASICRETAAAEMARLNGADAVIFDLRDNGGGYGSMVSLLAGYLFTRPTYIYSPRENPSAQSWTQSPVAGNRLGDKPVYVLISGATASAAEQFCYNLKMLKRATLVGETTRGSAHAGVFHRIDDHFGMGIPEVQVKNPYGKNDWEGVGVEPDVKVNAADALETAEKLAQFGRVTGPRR